MGQLEKYGLYVLCLVIFLILGVTIWGGGDVPQPNRRAVQQQQSDLNAGTGAPSVGNAAPTTGSGDLAAAPNLRDLLRPGDRPVNDPKKAEPKPAVGGPGQATPVNAAAGGNGAATAKPEVGATPPAPGPVATRPTHKVARGDTFEDIAREKLGNPALRLEIARLNPRVEPTRMREGQELLLPTAAEIEQALNRNRPAAKEATPKPPAKEPAAKAATGSGYYTIVKGDTFLGIAQRQLGSGKRVNEIKELNPTLDPTQLREGQRIRLPKK